MNWLQDSDPLNNIFLSAFIAAVPVIFIFWALIIRRMKGYRASLLTVLLTIIIAVILYRMPLKLALLSAAHGAAYGFFPICWIIITVVFLFNVTVKTGQFDVIRNYMASLTSDRRLQALLIAFSFGAFLEGTAGFGSPVAITAAMLAGLGFNPLYAAGICLIANTAPVAFGGVGVPIIVASQVSGLPEMAVSQMVGRTLPLLSLFVPFYLIVLMSGVRKSIEVLPAILVSGISFAFFQWFTSNYMSPMLPDIVASLASICGLLVLLRFWKPKNTWTFPEEAELTPETRIKYPPVIIFKAWSPFIILTLMIIAWGLQPVRQVLDSVGLITIKVPGLHNAIINSDGSNTTISQIFRFNYLSASGTAILISALLSVVIMGMKAGDALRLFRDTLRQLALPVITISSVLGYAYLANSSGMSVTIAMALTGTGILYPFFAPVLGWLGVFLTGSDTSSNALFGKLQYTAATSLDIDPVVTVSANATGGVTGKMISPQSIAIGAASVGLAGKESDLFRFTFKHSFIFLFIICILTVLQAYVIKWIVPSYNILEKHTAVNNINTGTGVIYLAVLAVVLILIAMYVSVTIKRKQFLK